MLNGGCETKFDVRWETARVEKGQEVEAIEWDTERGGGGQQRKKEERETVDEP